MLVWVWYHGRHVDPGAEADESKGGMALARPLRIDHPGGYYHVTSRGVAQQDIFLDDVDRETFLELLASEKMREDGEVSGLAKARPRISLATILAAVQGPGGRRG